MSEKTTQAPAGEATQTNQPGSAYQSASLISSVEDARMSNLAKKIREQGY